MSDMIDRLSAGTQSVIPAGGIAQKCSEKDTLRIKLGVDPTAPDLHLGHAVVLSKLRLFQEYGHHITFLIGDFTARIGDPSGKSKTRPALTPQEIEDNTATYLSQVSKIVDLSQADVRYNSQWLNQLSSYDWIDLCSRVTVARIIERDDFARRLEKRTPIGMHELLYPLMQGYDSVALHSDVEIGGTDQTFNIMMGRFLQEQYGQDPQIVMTVPILEGLDGVNKMSKSLGNAIGLAEPAKEAFGKLMSISDELMWRYYSVLLSTPENEIATMQERIANNELHPMACKKELAHTVIARFWSTEEAEQAQKAFEEVFEEKKQTHATPVTVERDTPSELRIIDLVRLTPAAESNTEARRLITSGAVKIDGAKQIDPYETVVWYEGIHIKVGKHRSYQLFYTTTKT